jgi:hypothetical protein
MEDPRELFLRNVRSRDGFQIDQSYRVHIRESILDTIFYTIADYVHHERLTDELHMGKLERLHSFPRAFMEADDPHAWLETHRHTDDQSLIMYVHDNLMRMTPGAHRRTLLYLVNILYFGL